jgi:cellulose synthase/poly-beta-1,6-N-acetylglucosamine synthase-like glycosyltransferase
VPPEQKPVRLSVVIPTYNRASFLPGCIESLRSSGIDGLEIVIVDDGSTDNTGAVVEGLQPGLTYVYQQNKMLGGARNTGIRTARGQYVSYLDSDDYWLPGVPVRILDMLDRHPEIGAIFADAQMGNPTQGYTSWFAAAGRTEFEQLPCTELEPGLKEPAVEPFYRLMLRRNAVFTGAIVLRREAVLSHGMFDETVWWAEDWEVWLRMMWKVRLAFWHEPMAIYTKHAEAATTDEDRMVKAWCDALRANCRKMPDVSAPAAAIRRATLRYHLFHRGYLAFLKGNYQGARQRFSEALRHGGFSLRVAALWLACLMPPPLIAGLRKAKASVTP